LTTYFFSGTAKWAGKKLDPKFQKYTIDLYMDEPSLALYQQSGIRVLPKTDPDGLTFYKLSRKATLEKKDGEIIDLGPPTFLNPDLTEYTGLVGNGSKVTVKVVTYDTMAGKGHRYESLRVDELVEYAPQTVVPPTIGLPF
jgi:hypothetical protein